MSYKIVNIDNASYDIKGIKLNNGKTSIYWTTKNNSMRNINRIVVILHDNNRVNINSNEVCIMLEKIDDVQNIVNMLSALINEMSKLGVSLGSVRFRFIVSSKEEEEKITTSARNIGITNIDIEKSRDYQLEEEKKEEVVETANRELDGSRQIEAANGMKYTEVAGENKVVANLGILDNGEELKILYDKYMMENPSVRRAFNAGMITQAEIFQMLQKQLIEQKNLKEYELNNPSENVNNTMAEAKANRFAEDKNINGRVSNETGIIKSEDGKFHTINKDNGEIKEAHVQKEGVTSKSYEQSSQSPSYGYHFDGNNASSSSMDDDVPIESDVTVKEEQQEERLTNQYGQKKVRVLKKTNPYGTPQRANAGFVNLPVIIFGISLLLLVASGIILFVIK